MNGRSGFNKQTHKNTLYHRCTQLGNSARPNYVMKHSNRDLLGKVTKNLAINIRFVVIIKANLECPIRFFVYFLRLAVRYTCIITTINHTLCIDV